MRHELVGVLDLAAFSRLRSEWNGLAQEAPDHSQSLTYEYCELAAASLFEKGGRLYVIKIYDERGLVLLWPIAVQRKAFVRVARDLRAGSGEEYGGPLLRPCAADDVLRASVFVVAQIEADLFELEWVDEGAALQRVIEAVPQPWLVRHAPQRMRGAQGHRGSPRYAIHFTGFASWDDFIVTRRHTVRKQHDNRRRKLFREQENVEFGWCREADDAEAVLTWLFENKKGWAKARGLRTAYLKKPDFRDFCIAMARRTDLSVTPLVTYIKINGKPVAASFNLVGPKILEFFISTYDQAFHPYSPGILLLNYVAQWAHENGRDFDMRYLHVDYKAQWANYTVLCRRHALFLTRGNVTTAVVLTSVAAWRISESAEHRLNVVMRLVAGVAGRLALPQNRPAWWRPDPVSGRRFAENEREIVGRHGNAFGQFKAMLAGKLRHLVQAAKPPGRIARLQAQIERQIGGSGLDLGLDIGAVEEENAAGRE